MIYILPKVINNEPLQKTIANNPELANVGVAALIDILKEKQKDKKDD